MEKEEQLKQMKEDITKWGENMIKQMFLLKIVTIVDKELQEHLENELKNILFELEKVIKDGV